jgi:hypothetical protein
MSINISKANINAFLKRIEQREKNRIESIFGNAAYKKRQPGTALQMKLNSYPVFPNKLTRQKSNVVSKEIKALKQKLSDIKRKLLFQEIANTMILKSLQKSRVEIGPTTTRPLTQAEINNAMYTNQSVQTHLNLRRQKREIEQRLKNLGRN